MEQQLDATHLRAGIVARATAAGMAGLGLGAGILLAAWGISVLWSARPFEADAGRRNPEAIATQDRIVPVVPPQPVKNEPVRVIVQVEQAPTPAQGALPVTRDVTPGGDVITREVTVFSTVRHEVGEVIAGWVYKDGTGGQPIHQFCYFSVSNGDRSSRRVDIASNGEPLPDVNARLVPELPQALAKCQWWQK